MVYGGTGRATTTDVEQPPASVTPETTQVPSGAPVQTQPAVVQQQYTGV